MSTSHPPFPLSLAHGHSAPTWMVNWSPDGRRLASASEDGTAIVWNGFTLEPLLRLAGHDEGVWSVTWSPDGQRLATGSNDGTAAIWTADSGGLLRRLSGHDGAVWATGFRQTDGGSPRDPPMRLCASGIRAPARRSTSAGNTLS